MSTYPRRSSTIRILGLSLSLLVAPAVRAAPQAESASSQSAPARESLRRADGKTASGRLIAPKPGDYRFVASDGASIPFTPGMTVDFHPSHAAGNRGTPPFRIFISATERISGRLRAVTKTEIRLEEASGGKLLTIPREGIVRATQNPGESIVFAEGFETLDPKRWTARGSVEVVDRPKVEGKKSARLSGRNSGLTRKLDEPVGSGRLELSYLDRNDRVEGAIWGIELIFREGNGDDVAPIRILPGWSGETIAVESPRGPSMVVQPLTRIDGRRRLSLRFSPQATNFVLDGLELARGGGTLGPLVEVRVLIDLRGDDDALPKDLAAIIDDLLLVRSIEPTADPAIDPTQDSIRLVSGDQLFGKLDSADADRLHFSIDDKPATIPWSRAISVDFRRAAVQSPAIDGLIVLARWRTGLGIDSRELDLVEGALTAVDDASIVVNTPRAGSITIPRDRLVSLQAISEGHWIVLDSTSHHLGNDIAEDEADRLDPPQPEGKSLEIPFRLDVVPEGDASLLLDVLQVEGEAPGLRFADEIRKGELRTSVSINGKSVDYINRHIISDNRAPESVRLAIPTGVLKSGRNVVRFDQLGTKENPEE